MRHPTSCSGSLTRAEIHPALRPTSFFSDPGREAAFHSAHPIPPPPLIELPGLRDPPDVDRLAEPYIRGLKVAGRPKLRPLRTDAPSPGVHEDHHVRDLTRANGCSIPHIVNMLDGLPPRGWHGRGRIGRVHGAQRLSVLDASIIPNGPAAFTHIPTIMLAERISEQITTLL
jgi:choline dehydrogenase